MKLVLVLTHVVPLHGLKRVIKRLEIRDAIVRVGRGTYTVSTLSHAEPAQHTLGVELDASDASGGSLVNDLGGDARVKLHSQPKPLLDLMPLTKRDMR